MLLYFHQNNITYLEPNFFKKLSLKTCSTFIIRGFLINKGFQLRVDNNY